MTDEKQVVLMIKGLISELPADEREKFKAAYDEIKAVVAKHGDPGTIALAMLGAENAEAALER